MIETTGYGCPVDCAKKLLQNNGIVKFEHIRITDSGLEKGKCPTTKENIEKIAMMGRSALIPN
ncbi:MAG: hypothetical protein JW915_14950 [Chitinispirillaceae bacterium]|nr:hypothetical protein [Chitinispirillaceae bacterium]